MIISLMNLKKMKKKKKKKQRVVWKWQEKKVINSVTSHLATPSESEIKYIIKE